MQRLTRNAPTLLLAGALASAAVLTLVLTSKVTFYADTWDILINRRDLTVDSLLKPHNEHLIAIPVLLEQLILRVFGMSSALPEYVLLTAFLLATAVLLYVYVKRRVGPWLALFAAVLVLFLGPAWEVILSPFEIAFCGPILCGLAMLLALEREDRAGDVAACAFLTLGLGFSSLGVPFVVAAAVAVLLGPRETWRRRAFVFVIPALVFCAWYVGWGHDAESHIGLRNVLAAPRYVADTIAVALGGLFGLGTAPEGGSIDPVWGRALLIALVIVLGFRQFRRPGFDRALWPVVAAAATSWFLTAFNSFPGREPTSSRYQYAGAIFILLILANLLKGVRPGRGAILAGFVITALAVGPNLVVLKEDGADYLRAQSVLTRADTSAIEIAGRTVAPDFQLTPEIAGTPVLVDITAASYLQAVDEYGSPAYSVSELEGAAEEGRRQADIVLANALPLTLATKPGGQAPPSVAERCVTVPPGGGDPAGIPLSPGLHTIVLEPGPPADITLRRFAVGEFPVTRGGIAGGSVSELRIPRDSVARPWRLRLEATQTASVCD
jgi:hypothetical protein